MYYLEMLAANVQTVLVTACEMNVRQYRNAASSPRTLPRNRLNTRGICRFSASY